MASDIDFGNGPIPVWREIGMGFFLTRGEASSKEKKNSSRVPNGTFQITYEWVSRLDEIEFPTKWGIQKIPHERRSLE